MPGNRLLVRSSAESQAGSRPTTSAVVTPPVVLDRDGRGALGDMVRGHEQIVPDDEAGSHPADVAAEDVEPCDRRTGSRDSPRPRRRGRGGLGWGRRPRCGWCRRGCRCSLRDHHGHRCRRRTPRPQVGLRGAAGSFAPGSAH